MVRLALTIRGVDFGQFLWFALREVPRLGHHPQPGSEIADAALVKLPTQPIDNPLPEGHQLPDYSPSYNQSALTLTTAMNSASATKGGNLPQASSKSFKDISLVGNFEKMGFPAMSKLPTSVIVR